MSDAKKDGEEDYLSVGDIRQWAQREVKEATKALELRKNELTDLVTAYAAGEITPQQADELHSRYCQRWGEALPGVVVLESLTDDQILAMIDRAVGNKGSTRFTERLRGKGGASHSELP
jgi:hypothetical protein